MPQHQHLHDTGLKGYFHKGPDHFYTQISPLCAQLFGAPEDYHPDMRWDDFTSPVERPDPEIYLREDMRIMEKGLVVEVEALIRNVQGEWMRVFMRKSRADDGGMAGESVYLPLHSMYNGWLQKLDHEREVLPLHNGQGLTRDELRMLHAVLLGIPRKLMARYRGVSVKTVEKRLHRVYEKLRESQCDSESIYDCLDWLGLTQMIMDRHDWFDLTPSYHSYPGSSRRADSRMGKMIIGMR